MDNILLHGAVRLCWDIGLDNSEDDKHIMEHRKIIIPVALNALVIVAVLVWYKYGPKKQTVPVEVKADTTQTRNRNP